MSEDITSPDDFVEEEDDTAEIENVSDYPAVFQIDNMKIRMKAGEKRRIPKAYAVPRQLQPNAPMLPPVVEQLTNKRVRPVNR